MMTTIRTAAFVAMIALAAGLPQHASAADVHGPDEIEEARRVLVQAQKVAADPAGYARASQLYRRAALLFGEHPEAADAWAWAGRLAFYTGDEVAVTDFDNAGDLALRFGDVGLAARSYLDAAFAAGEHGELETAAQLVERAADLTQSPYLDDLERERLEARIAGHTGGFRG